jgi:thioredoxin-related protein
MKIFISVLILALSSFGASKDFAKEFNYYLSYEKALKESKKTNKPIMMLISTQTCPWCRKLEAQTLRKDYINEYIQKKYIPLSVIKDMGDYPNNIFQAPAVPVIYFINSDEDEIGKIVGYKPHDKFIQKLKDTSSEIKPIIKTSPYSLENLKEFHVKFFDRSKLLNKKQKKYIQQKLTNELEALGIKTTPKEYSNFVIKIESVQLEKTTILNITLRIIEDIIPKRDKSLESIGITYYKNDMFELEEEPMEMIEESIFKYLVPEFVKQYKEENFIDGNQYNTF